MPIESINPATGLRKRSFAPTPDSEVRQRLERAQVAGEGWRRIGFAERAAQLKRVAAQLRRNRDEYAALMAEEMGKPLKQGHAECEKCALTADYYAENAESMLASQAVQTEAAQSFIAFEPLGVVLAIMPWNFPFWQVIRCAAPTLMAGNAIVLKHASNVPGCAIALEQLFRGRIL